MQRNYFFLPQKLAGPQIKHLSLWLLAVALPVVGVAILAEAATNSPVTAYQHQLQSQVQSNSGVPLTGRDPVTQPQISLAGAAAQPIGNGLRGNTPAAKVVGDHTRHVTSAEIIANPKTSGKLVTGCLAGYPFPGTKCVTKP